jgi:preprotein translocase subunit SecA
MDYLQEGIGLRAMAQRDPLVEYQREGFDMFAAMMDGIKEESVGFLFNLEVEVNEEAEQVPPPPAAAVGAQPQLDLSMLEAAQQAHEAASESAVNAGKPEIRAKGLDRTGGDKPLTYSAPELGSDSPSVRTEAEATASSDSATARRQQARSNPNRGSRGNKSAANRNKRKR